MDCSTAGFPVLHHLPEFAQTYVHRLGDVIQPSHPLTSPSPPAFNPSQHQGLFQWLNSSHLVAKELHLPFHYQSFQWISQLTSFRIEWFDFLADQGILKSLLQHHSSKASILRRSAFFMVQLSHPPVSMEFSRQEYWGELPFPSPGDLPNPGIKPRSLALQADSLPSEPPGKPVEVIWIIPSHTISK